MSIVMAPAKTRKNDNPYLSILTKTLAEQGVTVKGLPIVPAWPKASALHVHWLEFPQWGRLASRVPFWATWRMNRVIALARRNKTLGRPVLWTVHNLRPHDFKNEAHKAIYDTMCREFLPLVTDVICMSETVRDAARCAFPELRNARFHIIRHPHYKDHFARLTPRTPPELEATNLTRGPTLGTFGMLRAYKAIPDTIRAMKGLSRPFTFVIAGSGAMAEISAIQDAIGDDARFVFIPRRVSDEEILGMTQACDLIVFGFKSILNSGSVLAALSMNRPVLAPNLGAMHDLQIDLGTDWVNLYEGELTTEVIENVLRDLPPKTPLDLSPYDPSRISSQHAVLMQRGGDPT